MEVFLYLSGIAVFIFFVIAGMYNGSIISAISFGIPISLVIIALAKVIENQFQISERLNHISMTMKKSQKVENKVCPGCNREYDPEYNSCPHCGYRK